MSVIGEFLIPAESFALASTLAAEPDLRVEADRLASHSTMEVLPFVWTTGADREAVEAALSADETITEYTVAEALSGETLYRLEWDDAFCELINEMVDHHAAIVEATARDGAWTLRLRFAKADQVSSFQTHFHETGRDFEVTHLVRPREPRQREYRLTDQQYETLAAAARKGYFRVPREASVDDLGEDLGVSANAVSQRLRRGTETLVRNALTVSDDGAGGDRPED